MQNVTFARLLAQIIKLRAQFPDYPIKGIRMDNAGEFTSKCFGVQQVRDQCPVMPQRWQKLSLVTFFGFFSLS